jgi:hypothetical protein
MSLKRRDFSIKILHSNPISNSLSSSPIRKRKCRCCIIKELLLNEWKIIPKHLREYFLWGESYNREFWMRRRMKRGKMFMKALQQLSMCNSDCRVKVFIILAFLFPKHLRCIHFYDTFNRSMWKWHRKKSLNKAQAFAYTRNYMRKIFAQRNEDVCM